MFFNTSFELEYKVRIDICIFSLIKTLNNINREYEYNL